MKNWLLSQVHQNPTKDAVLADNASLTNLELYDMAIKRAEVLRNLTNTDNPNILVLLPNSVDFIIVIHAIMQLQGTLIPLNPNLTLNEVENFLAEIEVDLIITQENRSFSSLLMPKRETSVKTINQIIVLEKEQYEMVEKEEVSEFPEETRHSIIFTSGTTGKPKGAIITYGNLYTSALASQQRLGHQDNDRWLLTIPLHHIGGLSIVTRAVIYGITVVLVDRKSVV